jgi:hypothetical protein
MRQFIVFIILLLVAACSGQPDAQVDQPVGEIVFPSGEAFRLNAGIQKSVNQELTDNSGGYYLLQFSSSLDGNTRNVLEQVGVVFSDYIPNNAYYAYLTPESLKTLQQLESEGVLFHVGSIPTAAKLDPGLIEKLQEDPEQRLNLTVQFFEEPSQDEKHELELLMEVVSYSFGPVNFAEGSASAGNLEEIHSLSFVKWVEEQIPGELGENG